MRCEALASKREQRGDCVVHLFSPVQDPLQKIRYDPKDGQVSRETNVNLRSIEVEVY